MSAFDCIVSYHLDAAACGVARFNAILAARLKLPVHSALGDAWRGSRPLISVKFMEWMPHHLHAFERDWLRQHPQRYSLFLHDLLDCALERRMMAGAETVYCGNEEVRSKAQSIRQDARALWCPSLIDTERSLPAGDVQVFSFGMAHKIQPVYYRRLKELLDDTGQSYCLLLSLAIHHGSQQEDPSLYFIEEIFGGRACFLGTLSDAAVVRCLRDSHCLAAFFEGGVKANNTTVHTALALGTQVITNFGDYSPPEYRENPALLDIERDHHLTLRKDGFAQEAALRTAERFSWEHLLQRMVKG